MSWKSESLNPLEPSGPHRACYGTPLPFLHTSVGQRGGTLSTVADCDLNDGESTVTSRQSWNLLLSPKPDRLWSTGGLGGFFLFLWGQCGRSVKLTAQSRVMSRLKCVQLHFHCLVRLYDVLFSYVEGQLYRVYITWCFSDRASWIDYILITNFCALIIIYS